MSNYDKIIHKLESFIKRYYTNELIKGAILFFAIGLLYFLLTVSFEYFFWLGSLGRTILFWLFIAVEVGLFGRFILFPLAKLFKLSKGIDYYEASKIIGQHFPEVNDKLLNVIQLKQNASSKDSELALASIEQKSVELQPIPFQIAINFKQNLRYIKYAAIPLLIVLAIYISGNSSLFSEGYTRVVNYEKAYEPPAPFQFTINNKSLQVNENENFLVEVETNGKIIPEDAQIHIGDNDYLLTKISPGVFQFSFDNVKKDQEFYFSANKVESKPYTLKVTQVPTLLNFEMRLDYPAYLQKQDEVIKGNGNANIPEGTKVTWNLKTRSTDQVQLEWNDSLIDFSKANNSFTQQMPVYRNKYYSIATSNKDLKNYEKLSYAFKVVRDQFPEIEVEMKKDSVTEDQLYFRGRISDDYGLRKVELVYYPIENKKDTQRKSISISRENFDQFLYSFPAGVDLQEGKAYELFFQVYDNDGVNGSKTSKSSTFVYRKRTEDEEEERQLNNQNEMIQGMNKSLEKMKESNEELQEIDQLQKEKKQLNYNDQKKLERFIERQKQQEKMMKQYSKKMKENLEDFKSKDKEDPYKKNLEERFERNEKKLEENEKLLKELEKYNKKISKEELTKKLEKLSKQNINQQKNLEQLLELTKRYYVQEKAKKLASDLEKLSKKQEDLSNKKEENTSEAQKKMNKDFEELTKDIDSLQKENKNLKKPMELGMKKEDEDAVKKDQEEATKELEKKEDAEKSDSENSEGDSEKKDAEKGSKSSSNSASQKAQKKQQSAAKKMKQMSSQMQQQMSQSGGEQQQEDAEMLRQILDNLITFSFQQENLMEDFKALSDNSPNFGKKLRYQNVLRENFQHIDDSLYALALRNPMISEKITAKLTDVEFNLEKSLERLAQNDLRTGTASQQYTLTGANDLANLLGDALNQMQMSMQGSDGQGKPGKSGKGQGQGRGFQLPDIIKKQGDLNSKMQNGQKPGEKPGGEQQGQNGKNGQSQGQQDGQGKSGQGSQGNNGKGEQGQGQNGEQQSERLYEIYQEQQRLRMQLEDLIEREGLGGDAKRLAKSMDQIEQELLQNGFNRQTEERMMNLQHRLLQLKDASLKQGKDNKRQSQTNEDEYVNEVNDSYKKAKDYFNTTEILNRQSLPLRQNYKELVEEYFKE
ncbi:DUF4175 family protein [Mesonia aquimarina]|uniref:DUF4175 family protein n=1 Tax=Mesonia aquimarina TaxID=1504967 RepID=UPI000EF5D6CD|nr:DUF4175 family protein [Mesonia aquimarina]